MSLFYFGQLWTAEVDHARRLDALLGASFLAASTCVQTLRGLLESAGRRSTQMRRRSPAFLKVASITALLTFGLLRTCIWRTYADSNASFAYALAGSTLAVSLADTVRDVVQNVASEAGDAAFEWTVFASELLGLLAKTAGSAVCLFPALMQSPAGLKIWPSTPVGSLAEPSYLINCFTLMVNATFLVLLRAVQVYTNYIRRLVHQFRLHSAPICPKVSIPIAEAGRSGLSSGQAHRRGIKRRRLCHLLGPHECQPVAQNRLQPRLSPDLPPPRHSHQEQMPVL